MAEPEPAAEPEPVAEPEAVVEPEPVAEYESAAEPTVEPDHSLGLTGAAAAALAAAAAWGAWGQPAASIAEPSVEPEPEPYTPSVDDAPQVAEPAGEPYEAVAEAAIEPEASAEPQPSAAPAVSDSETWVATSMDTTPVPEPEAVSEPEPDAWATSDLETTPVPQREVFAPPEPEASFGAEPDEIVDADSSITSAPVVAPEVSDHEQIHTWADETTTYDLHVDVTSILGTAMHFAPAEVSGVAPQASDPQRQVVVNDQLAEAIFNRPPAPEPAAEPYSAWEPPAATPEPVAQPEPSAEPAVVSHEPVAETPAVAPTVASPSVTIAAESPFAATVEPVARAPFTAPADTYTLPSYEPIEIRPYESSYAPVVEPTHAAPAATEAPATEDAARPQPVPPAPNWPTEATGESTPSTEHVEAPQEHVSSSWLERAKARVADIYYDPDAEAPSVAEDEGGQTR